MLGGEGEVRLPKVVEGELLKPEDFQTQAACREQENLRGIAQGMTAAEHYFGAKGKEKLKKSKRKSSAGLRDAAQADMNENTSKHEPEARITRRNLVFQELNQEVFQGQFDPGLSRYPFVLSGDR